MSKPLICFIFILLATSLRTDAENASITLLTKELQQGSMVIAQLSGEGDVFYQKKKLQQTEQGIVVFGVGRDQTGSIELQFVSGSESEIYRFPITARQWNIERVDGLPPSKVTPKSQSTLDRIAKEAKLVKTARNIQSNHSFFKMPFIKPAQGRISGVYGSQRILNGIPKRPHFGLDIANKTGTPVVAPADGVVSLVHKDMFFSGGTLVLDHGMGISSSYIHLSAIEVEVGQEVKQGEIIAKIGATGRATGPHLDWRLNWFQTRLDPQLLIAEK